MEKRAKKFLLLVLVVSVVLSNFITGQLVTRASDGGAGFYYDFEDGLVNGVTNEASAAPDMSQAHSGTYSIKVTPATTSTAVAFPSAKTIGSLPSNDNKTYMLSVWIKAETGMSGSLSLSLSGANAVSSPYITVDSSMWHNITTMLTNTSTSSYYSFRLLPSNGPATYYIDDVSCVEVKTNPRQSAISLGMAANDINNDGSFENVGIDTNWYNSDGSYANIMRSGVTKISDAQITTDSPDAATYGAKSLSNVSATRKLFWDITPLVQSLQTGSSLSMPVGSSISFCYKNTGGTNKPRVRLVFDGTYGGTAYTYPDPTSSNDPSAAVILTASFSSTPTVTQNAWTSLLKCTLNIPTNITGAGVTRAYLIFDSGAGSSQTFQIDGVSLTISNMVGAYGKYENASTKAEATSLSGIDINRKVYIANSTGTDIATTLIVVSYGSGNRLVGLQTANKTVGKGNTDYLNITIPAALAQSGYSLKSFLWNNIDGMIPITTDTPITLQ